MRSSSLSRNSHGFGELNRRHSEDQPILSQTHNPCNRCTMSRGGFSAHLRPVTPVPSLSTVVLSGVKTLRQFSIHSSRNIKRTCLWWCGTPIHLSLSPLHCSTKIHCLLLHVIISYHQHCFQFALSPQLLSSLNRSSRRPVRSKLSTCTQTGMLRVSC